MNELPQATLLIHGGMVIDGLGQPPRQANVLLAGERITAVEAGLHAATAPAVATNRQYRTTTTPLRA